MATVFKRKDLVWLLLGSVFWGSVTTPFMNMLTTEPESIWHALVLGIAATLACTLLLVDLFRLPVPERTALSLFYPVLGGLIAVGARLSNRCFYGW